MDAVLNLLCFVSLLVSVMIIAIAKSKFNIIFKFSVITKTKPSPWDLDEFLNLKPSKGNFKEYYTFNEENVRSHTHRYLGRFDTAILHWEEAPILDYVIERKFPVNDLPNRVREEDIFQAGLYALAISESGASSRETKLVVNYCLQDIAKRCLERNTPGKCWKCVDGKKFVRKYNEKEIKKELTRLDEVWYLKRKPKASPSAEKCKACPYSKNGSCNYSAI